jgi:hypothetical protein
MNLTTSKWICINIQTTHSNWFNEYINKDIITVGKVYEFTKDTATCPDTGADLSHTSFIGDDGLSYLVDNDEINFIPLELHRQQQLDKILE